MSLSELVFADSITARYADGPEVLRGASLRILPGSRVVLLGANGCGKTTLLRCLCGSHIPSSGQVFFDSAPVSYTRKGLRALRRDVQLVLQDPDEQLFSADVFQDVSFGPTNMGLDAAEVEQRVAETLELLSISHLADRPCHQLSYGERKRVAIAGAVAMQPKLLLLDEPTAGLDPAGVRETLALLDRLSDSGTTIVLSTHDVYLALSQADQVGLVCDGQVIQGDPAVLLGDADLVAKARLDIPWPLELANRLGWGARPKNLADVVAELSRLGHC